MTNIADPDQLASVLFSKTGQASVTVAGLSDSWMRRPTGDQEVAGSTPAEVGNIFRGD